MAEDSKPNHPPREYYHSERWKGLKTEALKRAEYKCQVCHCRLHWPRYAIHHLTYDNWMTDKEIDDLRALCVYCHDKAHGRKSRFWLSLPTRDSYPLSVFWGSTVVGFIILSVVMWLVVAALVTLLLISIKFGWIIIQP